MSKPKEDMDLLADLTSHTADFALFTSYALDLSFFETKIFAELQKNNEDIKVVVLVDRNAYSEAALSGRYVRKAEAEYRLVPVDTLHGVFHPKVFFLCSESRADLYVGSANLTIPGFSQNLEIVDKVSTTIADPRNTDAFNGVSNFLVQLVKSGSIPEAYKSCVNEIVNHIAPFVKGQSGGEMEFGSSLAASAFDHFIGNLPEDIKEFTVVSPFHDERNTPLIRLVDKFPKAAINLITTGNTFPIKTATIPKDKKKNLKISTFKDSSEASRRLHAKVILARNASRSFLLTGSMNFTTPGFLADSDKGNVEAWIIRRLDNKTADTLFSDKYSLKELTKEPAYTPGSKNERYAAPKLRIIHASCDKEGETIRIVLDTGALSGKFQATARITGYLGDIIRSQVIAAAPGKNSSLVFQPSGEEFDRLWAACSVFVTIGVDGEVYTSNPIWMELQTVLSEDSDNRRMRESLEDFKQLIYDQDPSQNKRTIRSLIQTISRWLYDVQNGICRTPRSGGNSGGGERETSWNFREHREENVSVEKAAESLTPLFSKVLSTLDSVSATSADCIRKQKKKLEDINDEDEADSDSPRKIAEEIALDLVTAFTDILDSITQLKADKPQQLDVGLKTIQLLFDLTYIINITLIHIDEYLPGELRARAVTAYLNNCSRIMDICFIGKYSGMEYQPAWLAGVRAEHLTTELKQRHKKLMYTALVAIMRISTEDQNSKQQALLDRYRKGLAVLERIWGLDAMSLDREWPGIEAILLHQGQHAQALNGHDISREDIVKYLASQTQEQRLRKLFAPIAAIADCDKKLAGQPQDRQALLDRRIAALAQAEATAELKELVKDYARRSARFGDGTLGVRRVMHIVSPEDSACPHCGLKFVVATSNALIGATRWTNCPNCGSILVGIKKLS